MPERRRFPPPWSFEDPDPKLQQQCFIVRDRKGQALAYVYFEEELGRRAAAKLLTRDEARRIAANVAKLPKLLPRTSSLVPPENPGHKACSQSRTRRARMFASVLVLRCS